MLLFEHFAHVFFAILDGDLELTLFQAVGDLKSSIEAFDFV
jgi:hypothetical protein